jgi:hypothetical protein
MQPEQLCRPCRPSARLPTGTICMAGRLRHAMVTARTTRPSPHFHQALYQELQDSARDDSFPHKPSILRSAALKNPYDNFDTVDWVRDHARCAYLLCVKSCTSRHSTVTSLQRSQGCRYICTEATIAPPYSSPCRYTGTAPVGQ